MLRFEDYDEVFTPGAPIELADLFFGRDQELNDLERAIKRRGLHPIVIGNRGVGKTSLVNQAINKLRSRQQIKIVKVTCNSSMTFSDFTRAILRQLGFDINITKHTDEVSKGVEGGATPFGIGAKVQGSEKTSTEHIDIASKSFDPWSLYTMVRKVSGSLDPEI